LDTKKVGTGTEDGSLAMLFYWKKGGRIEVSETVFWRGDGGAKAQSYTGTKRISIP
jgi:hypothetical protein